MSYNNKYKSSNINIPNINIDQNVPFHYYYIIDDNNEPLNYKIKNLTLNKSTFLC